MAELSGPLFLRDKDGYRARPAGREEGRGPSTAPLPSAVAEGGREGGSGQASGLESVVAMQCGAKEGATAGPQTSCGGGGGGEPKDRPLRFAS